MVRQVFRWGEELRRHKLLIDAVLFALKCDRAVELPDEYGVEYALLRNGLCRGFAEIHSFVSPRHTIDHICISLLTVMRVRQLACFTSAPTMLIVRFEDGSIRAIDLSSHSADVRWCVPTFSAGDESGEPCVVVALEQFVPLQECVNGC
jgi:hypothetical protein